ESVLNEKIPKPARRVTNDLGMSQTGGMGRPPRLPPRSLSAHRKLFEAAIAVGARSTGAVGGNRGRRPIEIEEEEVESDGWRLAECQCSSSLRAALPDSAGWKPSEIPSGDSGQFPLSFPAESR
ncbi:MAG: hypothetical protein K2Z81_18295, partial [Cyanobacteria bacterium]|nr:hypothetical protein [Cyanobacteriota bacterium]